MLEIKNGFRIAKIYAAGIMQNEKPKDSLSGAYDRFEAVFVNSGKLTVVSGRRIFECAAGTMALFKPSEMHYIKLDEENYTEYTLVAFEADGEIACGMENSATLMTVLQRQLILSICNIIAESGEYNSILPSFFTQDSFAVTKLAATVELLMMDIATNKSTIPEIESRDALLFRAAVEGMSENVLTRLSVGDLADKLGISLSHLKRIFAAYTDIGAHEYFMGLKIEKAKKMLKSGISVTETAEKTGFNNQNYFSAAFKRIAGVSPKEYSGVKKKSVPQKTVRIIENKNPKPKTKTTTDMPSYLL